MVAMAKVSFIVGVVVGWYHRLRIFANYLQLGYVGISKTVAKTSTGTKLSHQNTEEFGRFNPTEIEEVAQVRRLHCSFSPHTAAADNLRQLLS